MVYYCRNTAQVGQGGLVLVLQFLLVAGNTLCNEELLRDTEQKSQCTANRKHLGAEAPCILGAEQNPSVTGSNVASKLWRPLCK